MVDADTASDTRPVVLYVEDDAETFRLAAVRLKDRFRLLWAKDDKEACQQLRLWGERLYAVLMDVELGGSGLDGLQLVRLVRGTLPQASLPTYARDVPVLKVPVVVLTAYTGRVGEREVRAVGASHFVSKPIDFTKLNLALAQANLRQVLRKLNRESTDSQPVFQPAPRERSGNL